MKRLMVGKVSVQIPYLGKFSFSRFRAKRAQKAKNMAKIGFLDFLYKIESLVFARNDLK